MAKKQAKKQDRATEYLPLPNGCKYTPPYINPANWESSKASIKKPWFVKFSFHDPIRGIMEVKRRAGNKYKTLPERQSQFDRTTEDFGVKLFPERNSIKLFLHGSVKSFTNSNRLGMTDLGFAMLDPFDSQIQFIFVMFGFAVVFRPPVCQDPEQRDGMLIKEWQNPVVENIGGSNSMFSFAGKSDRRP